ncbi:helix-turn-helix domain-containing protein [Halomicroarcula sp. F13]|uniref:Helix-turn-helix domain-containing protein n=1 Tax=Haloarcula rubra TaxID=2487747 RepID=A0AAW4PY91_9EURY|nr:helix-turn-helix domain-containing protein [Halomicroarcula rubra]MBX0325257.1 helix-turn-helix domain-containing protein [Halomicroarcula rubra]
MSDVTAVFRVQHPDLVLTQTLAHDQTATVEPISEAGTDPHSGKYLYHIHSESFEQFEAGLQNDHTIADYEQVLRTDDEAIYSFEYTNQSQLFSPVISISNGVALEIKNDGAAWIMTVWMPSREQLSRLWEFASENDIEIELQRVNGYASPLETDAGLTTSQREALLLALKAGYFEEPREASLRDVAAELGISQPAAGGLLRRGIKRLILSSLSIDR